MKKTKADALKTKELLIDKGYLLFIEKGYEATTLNEIVQSANLTRGAAYWHFKNKDELYIYVIRNILNKIKDDKLKIIENDNYSLKEKITHLLYLPIQYQKEYRLVNYTNDLIKNYPQFSCLLTDLKNAKEHLLDLLYNLLKDNYKEYEANTISNIFYFLFEGLYQGGIDKEDISYDLIKNMVNSILDNTIK